MKGSLLSFLFTEFFSEEAQSRYFRRDATISELWKFILDCNKCFHSHFSKDKQFLRNIFFVLDTVPAFFSYLTVVTLLRDCNVVVNGLNIVIKEFCPLWQNCM